jgi:hypothetical protein
MGLGDQNEGPKIGAVILLRTFLRPGYGQFYTQIFDLAVVHLRLPRTPGSVEDPNTAVPLTTLRQALIVVFKEAFPLARSQNNEGAQSLDATGIQLDNAYLWKADLKQAWMPEASLREVNLSEADLSEARLNRATLGEADLRGATLSGTRFEGALLRDTNLRGVLGLTKEQLESCNERWAVIDEDPTTTSSLSPISTLPPLQSDDTQTPSAPLAQGSIPTSDAGGSSVASSKPDPES